MPINEDGASQSVKFQYVHESDESFILNIEYHQTEIGNTVTIHNLLDSGPLSLPLSVYVDTIDHLRGRGYIPGGVSAKLPTAGFGGQAIRPMNKLQPTRVAGQPVPQYAEPAVRHPAPVVQQAPAAPQRQATLHDAQQVQNVYAPQHAVLQAENVTETGGMRAIARTMPVDDQRDDPTQQFDGSLSLAAGRAKREQSGPVDGKRTLKRIVRPGEPEYFEPPQG